MNPAEPIPAAQKIDLSKYPTRAPKELDRDKAEERTKELGTELDELEELLFAAGQNGLLIVLQGRDTSGKDGAIRHLLSYMNVQSCHVQSFKVPTPTELAHDFLWRIHAAAPTRGSVTIFNRSHYEDVIVVRVHELVPKGVWQKRYDHINAFERLLTDSGIVILKFYLHISREEQEERLLEREQDPVKAWKLSVNDWKERELWDDYTRAYEEALERCSTDTAPWFIVPSDSKWYRNLFITERVVEALRPMKKGWMARLEEIGREAKAELEAFRRQS